MRIDTPLFRVVVGSWLSGALVLTGCGNAGRNDDESANSADSSVVRERAGVLAGDSGMSSGGATGAGTNAYGGDSMSGARQGAASGPLTDAQIVNIALTANRLDSASAAALLGQFKSEEVRNFARRMVREHGSLSDSLRAAASRLGMTPAASPMSLNLEQMATQQPDVNGAALDQAYMEKEVVMHRHVLQTIDEQMLPQVRDTTLQALVQRMRTSIAAHLKDAESIHTQLSSNR